MSNKLHPKYQPQICPRCQQEFTCMQSVRCWCMGYEIPEELLNEIKLKYDGCLCEECVNYLIREYEKIEAFRK